MAWACRRAVGMIGGPITSMTTSATGRGYIGGGGREGGPFRVLFCGDDEFELGYASTAEELREETAAGRMEVVRCVRAEVASTLRRTPCHLAVPFMARFDRDTLAAGRPHLRCVMQFGVGLEGVDRGAAEALGVRVANIPGNVADANASSTAEMAVHLVLSLLRNAGAMRRAVARRQLGVPAGRSLQGKRVLIVGFGGVGQRVAEMLTPFRCTLTAVRKRPWAADAGLGPADHLLAERGLAAAGDLVRMAGSADVVVLACVLDEESRGIVGKDFFGALKPGAVIVNVSRGGLVDYDALRNALEANTLGGFASDVAWDEPLNPADPLVALAEAQDLNVIFTPHVGGVTDVSYRQMARILADAARNEQSAWLKEQPTT